MLTSEHVDVVAATIRRRGHYRTRIDSCIRRWPGGRLVVPFARRDIVHVDRIHLRLTITSV